MAGPLGDPDLRRLRTSAQLLHRPRRRSARDLVQHLAGVQAQVLSAAALALRARAEGLTTERVDRARLRDRSIVHTWAMRGTLHLIAAEDYGWLLPLVVEPRITNSYRRLAQEGVPTDKAATAIGLIERALESDGPLTRREIAERLARHHIRIEGQAIAHLVWLASARGGICYGPDRGRQRCFVLVRDWLGEPQSMEREPALAELAVRYLRAHGPASPADFALWSGLRHGDAQRAWREVAGRLTEVATARGPLWSLKSHSELAPRGLVRLLPFFDEYLLGWKDRGVAVPAHHMTRINRGGGWIHPVVVEDGQAVGTWSMDAGAQLVVHPFAQFASNLRRKVVADARDVAAFLERPVEVVVN